MKSSTINVSGTTNRGMPIVMQRVANLIHEIDQVLTRPDDDSLKVCHFLTSLDVFFSSDGKRLDMRELTNS